MSEPVTYTTADLWDANSKKLRRVTSNFLDFGGNSHFHGPIRTVVTMEDTRLAQSLFRTDGCGAVIVLDGGASSNTALLGDINAKILQENNWAGIVINGVVRDSAVLETLAIGIKALGTSPLRSGKTGIGAIDVPVAFGNVLLEPGQHIYCDPDGVLVSAQALPVPPVSTPNTYEPNT
ncbi:ribonuclease E activity regulator RraA [Cognatishimia sp. WU-CL00825]|uniref:ribonuclease E activity regulator RraA n=1 Tax=Cognatishimia sp. WU-CL00825 TaxID=3127658 RepID=UPI00310B6D7E